MCSWRGQKKRLRGKWGARDEELEHGSEHLGRKCLACIGSQKGGLDGGITRPPFAHQCRGFVLGQGPRNHVGVSILFCDSTFGTRAFAEKTCVSTFTSTTFCAVRYTQTLPTKPCGISILFLSGPFHPERSQRTMVCSLHLHERQRN